jgi:hypothetical protein
MAVAPPHLHYNPAARAAYEEQLWQAGADAVIPATSAVQEQLLQLLA